MISVFDLDKTLLRKNSSYAFGIYLFRQDLFSLSDILYLSGLYFRHLFFRMPTSLLHQKALSLLKGKSLSELKRQVEEFVATQVDSMLNHEIFLRLKKAQEEGHVVMLLSNSPDFLVQEIGKKFGISYVKGVEFDLDADCRLLSPFSTMEGEKKKEIVYREANLLGIHRKHITAYSDSHFDLPLLEGVGCPVAVNPDKRLRAACKKYGWEIVR